MKTHLTRILRLFFIGLGTSMVVASIINLVAASRLMEEGDEKLIGVSRGEIIAVYSVGAIAGVALILLALFRGKKRDPAPGQ